MLCAGSDALCAVRGRLWRVRPRFSGLRVWSFNSTNSPASSELHTSPCPWTELYFECLPRGSSVVASRGRPFFSLAPPRWRLSRRHLHRLRPSIFPTRGSWCWTRGIRLKKKHFLSINPKGTIRSTLARFSSADTKWSQSLDMA